jgi:DNA-binding HxlR family transcriptional regulator
MIAFCNWLQSASADGKLQALRFEPPQLSHRMPRSYCPINLSLEIFGDRWTLLVLRDMMFAGKRTFRELLVSDERIATNILTDRLKLLVAQGIVTKHGDPAHKQRAIYRLTDKGIELLPIIVQIGAWGSRHVPEASELEPKARSVIRKLQQGGPELWKRLMAELRAEHRAASARAQS